MRENEAPNMLGHPVNIARIDAAVNGAVGAAKIVEAGIPSICLGPGDIHLAHTTEESVPIDDLVDCAKAIAVTAMRFCGTA